MNVDLHYFDLGWNFYFKTDELNILAFISDLDELLKRS